MRKNLITIIFICVLIAYFSVVSISYKIPTNWSGWTFGDAQSIFCAEHWARDGFLAHKFLPLPSPYSLITKYLDEPELRHHAHGTLTGQSRPYRYYTHYPFGAMGAVLAVLMKFGIWDKYYFHLVHLIISLTGIFLFYLAVSFITGEIIAFISALFYLFSPPFYHYAASLSNISFNYFFRGLLLYLYILLLNGKEFFSIKLSILRFKWRLVYIISFLFLFYSFFP